MKISKTKLVSIEKMSKKQRKEYYNSQRGDWNGVNPVTGIVKSKKVYDRKKLRQSDRKDDFLMTA